MGVPWKLLRNVASWCGATLVGIFFIGPASNLVYDIGPGHDPDKWASVVIEFFEVVTESAAFHWIGGIIIGVAATAWLGEYSMRQEKNARLQHKQEVGLEIARLTAPGGKKTRSRK